MHAGIQELRTEQDSIYYILNAGRRAAEVSVNGRSIVGLDWSALKGRVC